MIADSSAWLELLRASGSAVHGAMRLAITNKQRIVVPDVVFQEVLQGASSIRQFEHLRDTLAKLPRFVPEDARQLHEKAASLYFRCRQAGYTVRRANDCLVAACAIESGEPLLQRDRDFVHIAAVDKRLILIPV